MGRRQFSREFKVEAVKLVRERGRYRRPPKRRAPAQPGADAPSISNLRRSSGLATAWIVRVETLV